MWDRLLFLFECSRRSVEVPIAGFVSEHAENWHYIGLYQRVVFSSWVADLGYGRFPSPATFAIQLIELKIQLIAQPAANRYSKIVIHDGATIGPNTKRTELHR